MCKNMSKWGHIWVNCGKLMYFAEFVTASSSRYSCLAGRRFHYRWVASGMFARAAMLTADPNLRSASLWAAGEVIRSRASGRPMFIIRCCAIPGMFRWRRPLENHTGFPMPEARQSDLLGRFRSTPVTLRFLLYEQISIIIVLSCLILCHLYRDINDNKLIFLNFTRQIGLTKIKFAV